MYQQLYDNWYAKELAYYEIDGKTSTLFAKSYGRQAISNLLSALKDSFKLEEGYNSSVVAAQAIKVKNAMTGSVQMEPEVMAAWDALIKSGKTYSEAEKIITDIRLNNPEILDEINHVISSAGYEYGVISFEKHIEDCETYKGTVRDVPLNESYKNNNVNVDNAKYVYSVLINAGFTKEAASAVMGNLDVEHAFSAEWSGDQGSVGIAQWKGSRKIQLEEYAQKNGGSTTDIEIQTAFMVEEDLENRLGKDGLEEFKNMTDFIDATDYFCDRYESPSCYSSYEQWENGKYGPNYASHGGEYEIAWGRYEWSDQLNKYELDLKGRRSAAMYWYNNLD